MKKRLLLTHSKKMETLYTKVDDLEAYFPEAGYLPNMNQMKQNGGYYEAPS